MKQLGKPVAMWLSGAFLALAMTGCAREWTLAGSGAGCPGSVDPLADTTRTASQNAQSNPIQQVSYTSDVVPAGVAPQPPATSSPATIPWPSEPMLYAPAQAATYTAPEVTPWPGGIAASFPSADLPPEPPVFTPWQDPSAEYSLSVGPNTAATCPSATIAMSPGDRLGAYWHETTVHVVADYRNYYRWHTALEMGIAVGLAAPLANTSLDQDFRDWYQQDVRSSGTDDLSSFWKPWGEGKIFVPAWAGLAVVGKMLEDRPVFSVVGDFSDRTTRAYIVGAPPMLLMQFVLGASRPGETPDTSHWKPFDDTNSVSGHAFIGAVPFLTAANMVENPWAKGTFYALSTFTGWSRVNDDRHYLSQVCLGWYMAYLAARSVDETQHAERLVRVVPIASPQMTGFGIVMQH